jgi:hypothetical protein
VVDKEKADIWRLKVGFSDRLEPRDEAAPLQQAGLFPF